MMGNLGGGVQSLPRAVTLNADRSLNFQPCAALARHRVGAAPVVALRNATAPRTLPLPLAALAALDMTVTVRGAAGVNGNGNGTGATSAAAGVGAARPSVSIAGLSLAVDFDTASPTGDGTLVEPMRTLYINGGGAFSGTIPVAGSLAEGVTFRIVIDDHIAEVFGGATPASFSFPFDAAAGAALAVAGGGDGDGGGDSGTFVFDVDAYQVAPATVTDEF